MLCCYNRLYPAYICAQPMNEMLSSKHRRLRPPRCSASTRPRYSGSLEWLMAIMPCHAPKARRRMIDGCCGDQLTPSFRLSAPVLSCPVLAFSVGQAGWLVGWIRGSSADQPPRPESDLHSALRGARGRSSLVVVAVKVVESSQ